LLVLMLHLHLDLPVDFLHFPISLATHERRYDPVENDEEDDHANRIPNAVCRHECPVAIGTRYRLLFDFLLAIRTLSRSVCIE
ncbi:MAG: hypothetical protein MJ033_07430, partial [Victivallaceae bacterium]|nr:hypothetical protein [Victivallaceae bacterium]